MYNTIEEIRNRIKEYFTDPLFTFDEPTHIYRYDGKIIYGATSFLERFVEKFDTEYWLEKKSSDMGITKEELRKEWDYKIIIYISI